MKIPLIVFMVGVKLWVSGVYACQERSAGSGNYIIVMEVIALLNRHFYWLFRRLLGYDASTIEVGL